MVSLRQTDISNRQTELSWSSVLSKAEARSLNGGWGNATSCARYAILPSSVSAEILKNPNITGHGAAAFEAWPQGLAVTKRLGFEP